MLRGNGATKQVWIVVALAAGAALGWATGHFWMVVAIVALAALLASLALPEHKDPDMLDALSADASAPALQQSRRTLTRARRLAKQTRALRDAAAALPDAVVLLDHDDRIRWFNHAAERLLGLVHPRDRGALLTACVSSEPVREWLRGDTGQPLNEVPAPTDPNAFLSFNIIPLAHGERLLLARDISTVMRLEQVRRDFVSNVSHELRTPLTVIHGYLELVEPADVPALAPVLGEMRVQSRRMGQIVEDLLTLSRLETQQLAGDEDVAMRPLLATLRKEAEALSAGRHAITLENEAGCDLRGSPRDLHSAFSNLVSNAVRYTPDGGRITLRWQREADGGARFSVSDTGYGIPAQHIPRLTERFYRVSSSRSRETGGTGLGLSIVKHVLALHHARFEVESEPGRGSTFACVFGAERVVPADKDGGDD
ncbi:MAG: phosphate regulon sensor histidine kinase PhoR [Proteobacteria bacterium]|nr:phosphate regulon sensor histidine kinase PhoR [Pseudomonadota bacterium]